MDEEAARQRIRRWRLILGKVEMEGAGCVLSDKDAAIDRALGALYEPDADGRITQERRGDLSASAPAAARWLGDIRTYFPASVVQVMQKDALERLGLKRMLLEPEMLNSVEPDVHLVAALISLSRVIPARTRDTARQVVRKVADDLERKLAGRLRQAISGALNRSARNRRPRLNEIDWDRTIRANLKHYQPEYRTLIPESRIGHGRKGEALRDVILCIDQSGSMAGSVVYAGILGAVMATIRSVRTSLVVFDTAVADLTDKLADPVDVLFGTQLGGGTDINQALAYCQTLVRTPAETILVLISDLYEGGDEVEMIRRAVSIRQSGVNFVTLLALDDQGAPPSNHAIAAAFAGGGIPTFACTPDRFPELMAAAIQNRDLTQWAAQQGIVAARSAAAPGPN